MQESSRQGAATLFEGPKWKVLPQSWGGFIPRWRGCGCDLAVPSIRGGLQQAGQNRCPESWPLGLWGVGACKQKNTPSSAGKLMGEWVPLGLPHGPGSCDMGARRKARENQEKKPQFRCIWWGPSGAFSRQSLTLLQPEKRELYQSELQNQEAEHRTGRFRAKRQ